MAKLITPHLKDVAPTPVGLQAIPDRLIEVSHKNVGVNPHVAVFDTVRITLASESGDLQAAVNLTVGGNGTTEPLHWADLSVGVLAGMSPEVTSRLNRLLSGFVFKRPGTTSLVWSNPVFGMDWRTKKVTANYRRKRTSLPVVVVATPSVLAGGIATRWNVKPSVATTINSNASQGFTVVTPSASKPKAAPTKASTKVTPKTPSVAPSPAPKGAEEEVTSTPTVAPKAPVSTKLTPAQLEIGIFKELSRRPFAVHTDPSVAAKLNTLYAEFSDGHLTVAALRGPSGAGKTLSAMELAASKGLPFAKFEVQGMADFIDWFGAVDLKEVNGQVITQFVPSDFYEAVRADGPYAGVARLILLDEITRTPTAQALNALMAVLDNSGSVYIPSAKRSITIDPAVMFVVTANIGAGFTGTVITDTALNNRVTGWITVDYLPEGTEAKVVAEQGGIDNALALQIVKVAAQLRAVVARGELPVAPSTRQLVRVARHVKYGLTPIAAYEVGFADDAAISREGGAQSDFTKVMAAVNAGLRK